MPVPATTFGRDTRGRKSNEHTRCFTFENGPGSDTKDGLAWKPPGLHRSPQRSRERKRGAKKVKGIHIRCFTLGTVRKPAYKSSYKTKQCGSWLFPEHALPSPTTNRRIITRTRPEKHLWYANAPSRRKHKCKKARNDAHGRNLKGRLYKA